MAYRSSFNESLPPMWGLHEFWMATGESEARETAGRNRRALARRRALVEDAGSEGKQWRRHWGSGPSELLTLHALRVLRAAGRFSS